MKTRLLKKVRSRYSITHYPKGVRYYGHLFTESLSVLTDNNNEWRSKLVYGNKTETFDELYDQLKKWIRLDYETSNSRHSKFPEEQLWYKK